MNYEFLLWVKTKKEVIYMFAKLIFPGMKGGEQFPAYPCYNTGDIPGHGNCYEGGIPLDGKCVNRGIIPQY